MSILYQVKISDYENMLLMDKDTSDIDKAINDELGGSQNLKLFLYYKYNTYFDVFKDFLKLQN